MENRRIFGADRDTIDARDYLTPGEVERLKASGIELDAREKRVLQAIADQVFAKQRMTEHRATLARLDAESDAARIAAQQALNVYSISAPGADDDYFVICDASVPHFPFYVEPPSGRDQAELILCGSGLRGHWIPRKAAEAAIALLPQRRLPFDYVWQHHTPSDLLDAVRFAGNWQPAFASQHRDRRASDGILHLVDEKPEINWAGILKLCSTVAACTSHVSTLKSWLASAESSAGDHYAAFADKLRQRLKDLGADDAGHARGGNDAA